jgi:hypothetical protein
MPLQELPLVALQSQEKTAFITSGLPQISGAFDSHNFLSKLPLTHGKHVKIIQKIF